MSPGVALTSLAGCSWQRMPVSDGTGGVIATWAGNRSGTWNVCAQRVDGHGALRWGGDGFAVDTTQLTHWRPAIASDGAGGAIVTWNDYRNTFYSQIYAQRYDSTGAERWAHGGLPLALTGHHQYGDTLLADGHGGLFAAWFENPYVRGALWGQHLDGSGAPLWGSLGSPIDSTQDGAGIFALAADGSGGLLVGYDVGGGDIRAQSMSAAGVPRWVLAGVPVTTAPKWQGLPAIVGDGHGGLTAAWPDWRAGGYSTSHVYAQHVGFDGSAGDAGVPPPDGAATLALEPAGPNPARAGAAFRIALPAAARIRLAIHDVAGRDVRLLENGPHAAGTWTARWDGRDDAGRALPTGLYFVRLDASGAGVTRKLVLVP